MGKALSWGAPADFPYHTYAVTSGVLSKETQKDTLTEVQHDQKEVLEPEGHK